jgi:hypothetical protein
MLGIVGREVVKSQPNRTEPAKLDPCDNLASDWSPRFNGPECHASPNISMLFISTSRPLDSPAGSLNTGWWVPSRIQKHGMDHPQTDLIVGIYYRHILR